MDREPNSACQLRSKHFKLFLNCIFLFLADESKDAIRNNYYSLGDFIFFLQNYVIIRAFEIEQQRGTVWFCCVSDSAHIVNFMTFSLKVLPNVSSKNCAPPVRNP